VHLELTDLIYMTVTILGGGGGGAYFMRRRMIKNGGKPGPPPEPKIERIEVPVLTKGERDAIYGMRDGIRDLVEILCAKDELKTPLIFKAPAENKRLLKQIVHGLERTKPGCTAGGGPGT